MPEALPEPAICRAGCAQKVITPPTGVSLAGYFHDRIGESVRDDLFARAVVVEANGERAALVSCDLVCMTREISGPAKEMIEKEAGIPPERVLIAATHTHTGPELRANGVVPQAAEWVPTVPRMIADVVKAAADSMFTATLRPSRTEAHDCSFNRLFRLRDGMEVFGQRGEVVTEAGPIDPELTTLSIVDEEGELRALVANFALHVDVIGGGSANFISADWPGEMARNVAAVYGKDVVTVFLQGTCGDINHHAHSSSHLPRGGPTKAVQLGRALAGAAMYAAERGEPMGDATVAGQIERLAIPYYTRDDKLMAEIAELRAKPDLSASEKYTVERCESWPNDGQNADVPVQAIRIGDVGFVGLPAEIFVKIGLEIKHFSPAPYTSVVELANERSSTYVPTTDQAERGAYGAKPILSRWLCADAGRRMADAAQVMLWRLWG